MSSKRVTVSTALFVCKVLKTKWPVREASMPVSAVQILMPGVLMFPSTEWSVVVFHDPVGPAQRMIP